MSFLSFSSNSLTLQVAGLEARLAGKTAECCHLQTQLGRTQDSSLASETASLRQELSDLSRAYAKLGVKHEAVCTELGQLTSQLQREERELAESRQRENQLEQQVIDLRQQLRVSRT